MADLQSAALPLGYVAGLLPALNPDKQVSYQGNSSRVNHYWFGPKGLATSAGVGVHIAPRSPVVPGPYAAPAGKKGMTAGRRKLHPTFSAQPRLKEIPFYMITGFVVALRAGPANGRPWDTRKGLLRGPDQVERVKGFEPSTSTLARLHSTTELHPLDS